MSDHIQTKAVVTVAEMARMVGLSRARFYQLQQEGIFPLPLYDIATRRPIYPEAMQEACLEVRRKNCGANGKPILFYARRIETTNRRATRRVLPPTTIDELGGIVEGVKSLGLMVKSSQVKAAVKELFPQGITQVDQGEVIRAIFVQMKRRNRDDNAN